MLTRRVPKKVSVPNIADLPLATEIGKLLAKYGYGMTSFGSAGVGLYKKSALKDGDVPVDCWYFFSKREFAIFYEVLKQLEESDRKLNNYIKHLSTIGFG
jgi:hypothetical protein